MTNLNRFRDNAAKVMHFIDIIITKPATQLPSKALHLSNATKLLCIMPRILFRRINPNPGNGARQALFNMFQQGQFQELYELARHLDDTTGEGDLTPDPTAVPTPSSDAKLKDWVIRYVCENSLSTAAKALENEPRIPSLTRDSEKVPRTRCRIPKPNIKSAIA